MALTYTGVTIGTLTLCQPVREKQGDEWVIKKDERGRTVYDKFPIVIREANVLACFLHIWKDPNPKDPDRPWHHELQMFFDDETHMKRCLEKNSFEDLFLGKLTNIKLNLYYKEMQTLQKYMVRAGLKVTGYYKEPKKK